MSPRRRLAAIAVVAAALLAGGASPAAAAFHLMSITEVFAGAPGNAQAQYVELQMYTPGQNFVGGHSVRVYNAAGTQVGQFTFADGVANGANQSTILVATQQAADLFGLEPDLLMTPVIAAAGGKVCFDNIDCVSWGSYTGSSAGTGTPFNQNGGIPSNLAAVRDVSGGNDPGNLDGADDTGSSANDFDARNPAPRTNSGSTGAPGLAGMTGDTLDFQAATGSVADNVTLSGPSGGFFLLRDTGRAVSAGAGCEKVGATDVRCPANGTAKALLELAEGKDVAKVTASLPATIEGQIGDDTLTGGGKDDFINGGFGNDLLVGGLGADDLSGGPDTDTVSYAARTGGVTVNLDPLQKNSGSALDDGDNGRRDWARADLENIIGGSGHDTLDGTDDDNVLDGGPGADIILGGFGFDTVTYAKRTTAVTVKIDQAANDGNASDEKPGTTQRDNVFVENITGGSGGDTLVGSGVRNVLIGGGGSDSITALGGPDEIFAKDGKADSIVCGADTDKLHRDAGLDTFEATGDKACETVD